MKGNFNTVEEFMERLKENEKEKQDYVVPTSILRMENDRELSWGDRDMENLSLNDWAHGQLANYLKIPKRYYDAIGAYPGLRTENVNTLIADRQEKRMVRTIGNTARALVSDRFKPIDNQFVMAAFGEAMMGVNEQAEIKSASITDRKMYVQIVFPNISKDLEPSVGDIVQYGITVTNSEVGAGAMDIRHMIYRLACKNGMVSESLVRQYHAGRRIDFNDSESYEVYRDDTMLAELKSYRLRIRDILSHALKGDTFREITAKLIEAKGQEVTRPQDTVQNVTKRWGFTDDTAETILGNMVADKDFSRYGLVNAVTRLGNQVDDADRQYEFEQAGSEILTLKPTEWEKLSA